MNNTALKEIGLQRVEVTCSYGYIQGTQETIENKYISWKDFASAYTILNYKTLRGDSASLDSKYSSIQVECVNEKKIVLYENILMYVPGEKHSLMGAFKENSTKQFNVMLLIIDGVSQQNMIRSWPKTLSRVESIGGVFFKGHHKVSLTTW